MFFYIQASMFSADVDYMTVNELELHVATWNLMDGRSKSYQARIDEAVEHLHGFDVILLQEASYGNGVDAAAEIASKLGLTVAAASNTMTFRERDVNHVADGNFSRCAILTRLPVVSGDAVPFISYEGSHFSAAVLIAPSGRPLVAASAHLVWGGKGEYARALQAQEINAWVEEKLEQLNVEGNKDAFAIVGGDFNTTPQSKTVRYMTGLDDIDGDCTLWVDVWSTVRESEGYTVLPDNEWAASTAAIVGIANPERLPKRRIDYLFVYGWAYGRPGSPLRAWIVGREKRTGIMASDHLGVGAILADPLPL